MNKNPEANQNKKWVIVALILGVLIILAIAGIVIYKQRERAKSREPFRTSTRTEKSGSTRP